MSSQKNKLTLEQRVLQYIRQNNLLLAGQTVLVAVSGGPDSVCLLNVLYKIQTELQIKLYVAHLNHQLRGAESEADARYVADLAQKLGLPAVIEKLDVAAYQIRRRLSLEEAAREVRYNFLAQTARKIGAERVAAGHTLNDQVETILLHIIRGTGTRGLKGLQPCHEMQFGGCRLTVIRPLLEVRREETADYCARLHLTVCLDTSNLSLSLLRNRVRRELLPLLKDYNSGIFESLLRISAVAGDDLAYLEAEADRAWPEVVRKQGNTFIFDREKFKGLAPALQRHLLRRAIDSLLGTLKDIEARHIEEIMAALNKSSGRRIVLPEGLIFSLEYDRYLLGSDPEDLVDLPVLKAESDLLVTGRTELPGWAVEARVLSREEVGDDLISQNSDPFSAYFDKDKVGIKIIVRARRAGDRFQPLGMNHAKKVGEFMVDARIPRPQRNRVPIIVSSEQIIWVAGWRIDERVKVTAETRRVLWLRLERRLDEQSGKGRGNSGRSAA